MTVGSNTSGHLFDTSLTADGILYASSTGVITSTAAGTATNVLTSNGAGVAPTFQAVPAGITGPGSSTNNGIATWNGTGGTALFSRASPIIDSTGRMTNANQPCFMAYCSASKSNVTGNNGAYVVLFDTTTVNQGSGYATGTGVFTAPVAGNYLFTYHVTLVTTSVFQYTTTELVATSITTQTAGGASAGQVTTNSVNAYSQIIAMSANDTVHLVVVAGTVANTANTSVLGGGTSSSFFSGYLVC